MSKSTAVRPENPQDYAFKAALDEVVRKGAQKMMQQAVELEAESFLERHQHIMDDEGKRLVVRNGHHNERSIATV